MPEEYRRQEDRDKLIQLSEAVSHMNKSMEEVKSTLADIRASLGGVQVMQNEVVELKNQNADYRKILQEHEVKFGQIKLASWIFGVSLSFVTGIASWAWSQLGSLNTTDNQLASKVLTLELKLDNVQTLQSLKSQTDPTK